MESIGFEFNTYDPNIANRIKVGKQHTVRFHVDDVMSSHGNSKVNYKFKSWMNRYSGKHGEVKFNGRKGHKYLVIIFYFTEKVKVKINMDHYVERVVNEFQ